jgi:tetratricopeptide (TPR) repeat protein
MIERHYDDEALISLIESNRADSDVHVPSCKPCGEKIESFRMIADAMTDRNVWDSREVRTEGVPATIATLRAFADRMTDEDIRADAILRDLLLGSREEWLPRLEQNPEWRTAGVVRKLIDRAYAEVVKMPPDAVAMTTLATAIADGLDPDSHPSDTVARLRGSAWRAKGYALFYVGQFTAADSAVAESARSFDACMINEYELARLGIVKALVLRPFERYSEASDVALASADTFSRHGDMEKMVSAKLAEVPMLIARNRHREAELLLLELEHRVSGSVHVETHARVLGNLGQVYKKLGKVEAAIHYFDCASALLDDIGARTETLRIQWNVAVMLAEAGHVADACNRLTVLTREMEHLGMTNDAAIASLDVAELLLAQSRYHEVSEICRSTMQAFELAGLSYTTRALTALAYIREAANKKRPDRTLVRHVRQYIRELPQQPNLLFALPPL